MNNNNKSKNREVNKGEIYGLLGFFCLLIMRVLQEEIGFIYSTLIGVGFFVVSDLLYKKFGNIKMTKLTGTQLFIILVGVPLGVGFICMLILIINTLIVIF